jgi:hypothetical protein
MCAKGRELPEGYVKSRNIQQRLPKHIHYTLINRFMLMFRSLAEPDLSKVCLVDNSPVAYELYQGNHVVSVKI